MAPHEVRHGWSASARCADPAVADELFPILSLRYSPIEVMDRVMFPEKGTNSSSADVRSAIYADARSVCAGCPVAVDCLEAALAQEGNAGSGRFGMRGGLDPDERTALVRRRRRRDPLSTPGIDRNVGGLTTTEEASP